ncbi:glycoside hydrolase family protein [Flavobacterium pectinovorum]|nr:glycoside hydrolase family protein [Flavobacterium pectinovorum]
MLHSSTITFDPIKNQFDYNKTFQPTMKLNADGAIAIAQYESLSLTVYDKDSNTGQNTTIGFGHLLHYGAIKVGDIQSITMDQAVSYLAKDIVVAQNTLNQKIENSGLTGQFNRSQYLALVDMTFNGGNVVDNILSAMKSGGVKSANSAFTNSYLNETNGGLKDRRYFEAQAFINGRSLTPEQANAELVSLGLK